MSDQASCCVQCGQPLPGISKMTNLVVSPEEAEERNWSGIANPDGTLTVKMCLQCQMVRSAQAKTSSR